MVFLKVPGQRIEKLGVNRLWRPRFRYLHIGSISGQIKIQGGVHNPYPEQLRPNEIYRSAGKLDMTGNHAGVSLARVLPRSRFLAGE